MHPYHYNKSKEEHCPYCLDDGIVTLKGSIKKHGHTYSRGSAPCKWCEAGTSAYLNAQKLRLDPASQFTLADIEIPEPYVPASKADARAAIAAIQATWQKPRLVSVDKTETKRDVEARILAARQAIADELAATEPEPFTPAVDDDIPF